MGNFFKIKNSKIPYWIWLILLVLLSLVIFGLFTKDLPSVDLSNESKGITSNIRNVAYYFFSTISQTIGALVAIVLTYFFTMLSNLKTNENLFANVIRIRLYKDDYLTTSIIFCFIAILFSIFGISISGGTTLKLHVFILLGSLVLSSAIIGIFLFVYFMLQRAFLYNNPSNLFFKDAFTDYKDKRISRNLTIDEYKDFSVLAILLIITSQDDDQDYHFLTCSKLNHQIDESESNKIEYYIAQTVINSLNRLNISDSNIRNSIYRKLFNFYFDQYKDPLRLINSNVTLFDFQEKVLNNIIDNIEFSYFLKYLKVYFYEISNCYSPLFEDCIIYSFFNDIVPFSYENNMRFYSFWLNFSYYFCTANPKYTEITNSLFFKRIYDIIESCDDNYNKNFNKYDEYDRSVIIDRTFDIFWFSLSYELLELYKNKYVVQNDLAKFNNDLEMLKKYAKFKSTFNLDSKIEGNNSRNVYFNLDQGKIELKLNTFLRYKLDIPFNLNMFSSKINSLFNDYILIINKAMTSKNIISYLDSEKMEFYKSISTGINQKYPDCKIEQKDLVYFMFGFLFPHDIELKLSHYNNYREYSILLQKIIANLGNINNIQKTYFETGFLIGYYFNNK